MRAAVFGLAGLLSIAAAAQENPLGAALNNFSHEMVECSAFYAVSSLAVRSSKEDALAAKLSQAAVTSITYANVAAEGAGLKKEVTLARLKMMTQTMTNRIDNNASNISILLADYSDLCRGILENTDARINYWVAEMRKRQGAK